MSLMRRLMEAKLSRAKLVSVRADLSHPIATRPTEAPVPAPTRTTGSCKALNPSTGRQCALPAGHQLPHRHGSTPFMRAATPGEAASAREHLDRLATATTSSFLTGE